MAAFNGHKEVVKLLSKLGADMTAQSQFGTAVDAALEEGHFEVAESLARYASQCACCEKKGTVAKVMKCSRCVAVFYCSAACQKQD